MKKIICSVAALCLATSVFATTHHTVHHVVTHHHNVHHVVKHKKVIKKHKAKTAMNTPATPAAPAAPAAPAHN